MKIIFIVAICFAAVYGKSLPLDDTVQSAVVQDFMEVFGQDSFEAHRLPAILDEEPFNADDSKVEPDEVTIDVVTTGMASTEVTTEEDPIETTAVIDDTLTTTEETFESQESTTGSEPDQTTEADQEESTTREMEEDITTSSSKQDETTTTEVDQETTVAEESDDATTAADDEVNTGTEGYEYGSIRSYYDGPGNGGQLVLFS